MNSVISPRSATAFSRAAFVHGLTDPHAPDLRETDQNTRERLTASIMAQSPQDIHETVDLLLEALQNAQRENDKLNQQANTDALTGLFNKGAMDRLLAQEVDRANQFGQSIVLLGIDLDGFKGINDRYGHPAGDAVLQKVADILLHNTRKGDIVARPGGDEFSILLVNADPRTSHKIISRLNRVFAKATCHYEGHELPVRASIGMAGFKPNQTMAHFVDTADQAMYSVKRGKPHRQRGILIAA